MKLDNVNAFQYGTAFAGCILGAGFVSGKELHQFFTSYGEVGFWGYGISMVLFFLIGCLIAFLAKKKGTSCMDEIIVPDGAKVLRGFVGLLENLLLFGIFVIMAAAVGALGKQLLGLPPFAFSLIFCLTAAVITSLGIKGLSAFFSLIVPILTVCALTIAVLALVRCGGDSFAFTPGGSSRLLPHYLLSSVSYVSLNIFLSVGILAPL
ncbi:MAG: hypothetical protein MJ078_01920, partial [Clostridia bacterium]|nr:hypothetical protein [Clostridia bacterium]